MSELLGSAQAARRGTKRKSNSEDLAGLASLLCASYLEAHGLVSRSCKAGLLDPDLIVARDKSAEL